MNAINNLNELDRLIELEQMRHHPKYMNYEDQESLRKEIENERQNLLGNLPDRD